MNDGNLKPFKKNDGRINRKGRPKTFDALRELSRTISHEVVTRDGEPVVMGGHALTVVEAILRQWAQSKNPALQLRFMEIAYGKVPVSVEVGGKTDDAIPIIVVGPGMLDKLTGDAPNASRIDYRRNIAALAPLDE